MFCKNRITLIGFVGQPAESRSISNGSTYTRFPSVVALMGTALFPAAEIPLSKRFQHVILMLDGDGPGRQTTKRIAAQLAGKCSVTIVSVPTDSQPDQLNRVEITALLESKIGPQETA